MKNVISALFLFFLLTISIPVFAEKNQVTFLDPINAKEYAELFIKNELGVTPQNLNIVFEVFDTDDSVLGYRWSILN